MALNVVIPFLIPLEENIFNATRLLSNLASKKLSFETYRYCTLVFEDAPVRASVITVFAKHVEGQSVRYSIVGGNKDGLFSVDSRTGHITIAAPLDHEVKSKHTLIVSSETPDGEKSEATVDVRVADINDNIPKFTKNELKFTVIEEDQLALPIRLGKVVARDYDWVDQDNLLYTLIGDGVDGYSGDDAFFSIHPQSGEIIQLRSLNRDPPNGKPVWRLRVKVHDGQSDWVSTRTKIQNVSSRTYSVDRKWNSRHKRKLDEHEMLLEQNLKKIKTNLNRPETSQKHLNDLNFIPENRKFSRGNKQNSNSTFKIAFVESFRLNPGKDERSNLMLNALRKDRAQFLNGNIPVDNLHKQRLDGIRKRNSLSRIYSDYIYLKNNISNEENVKISERDFIKFSPFGPMGDETSDKKLTFSTSIRANSHLSQSEKDKRHSRTRDKEVKRTEKRRYLPTLPRQIRHVLNVKDNCDILESLIKPLDSSQRARLKYLISQQKKNRKPIQKVHVVESLITISVTDINDNPPVFPNTTIHVEVQENGPKDIFVAIVTAWDADDPGTSSNAKLRYYLEKNAVDERNGAPIFRIDPWSGEIRTSLCCLDRESTFEYLLQVVATDGGGLKGWTN